MEQALATGEGLMSDDTIIMLSRVNEVVVEQNGTLMPFATFDDVEVDSTARVILLAPACFISSMSHWKGRVAKIVITLQPESETP